MPVTAVPDPTALRVQSLTEFRNLAADPFALTDKGFVQVMKLCRTVLEISDEELADEVRVSRPTVNRWKNNKNLPHPALRSSIAAWIVREASKRLRILSGTDSKTRLVGRGRRASRR
jgi:transcriptional regulator with XRE-family HTH domain